VPQRVVGHGVAAGGQDLSVGQRDFQPNPPLTSQITVGRPPGAPALDPVTLVGDPVSVSGVSAVPVLGGVENHVDNLAGAPQAGDDDGLGPLVPLLEPDHDVVGGHVGGAQGVAVHPGGGRGRVRKGVRKKGKKEKIRKNDCGKRRGCWRACWGRPESCSSPWGGGDDRLGKGGGHEERKREKGKNDCAKRRRRRRRHAEEMRWKPRRKA
jgi:hypothetical protein